MQGSLQIVVTCTPIDDNGTYEAISMWFVTVVKPTDLKWVHMHFGRCTADMCAHSFPESCWLRSFFIGVHDIGTERLAPKMSFGDSGRVVRGMPHGVTTPILHVDDLCQDRTRHTDWQGFCSALSVRKRGSLKYHPPRFARKAMCDFVPEWCFCRWHRAARCHLECAKVRIVCERVWTLVRQCLWARPRR